MTGHGPWLSTVATGVGDRQEKRPIKLIKSAEPSGIFGQILRENGRDRSKDRVKDAQESRNAKRPVTIPPPSDFERF